MYIPKHFEIEDRKLSLEFIRQYNFGLLLCNGNEIPATTHLPFYVEENSEAPEEKLFLISHLAKANPHWQEMERHKFCLLIFNGPNGYVSPSLYSSAVNVPTWNYMSVHVKVNVEIIHETEKKKKYMHQTILQAEKEFEKQYNELSPEYLNAMYSAIVFLRLEVLEIETKFKLSQNKPEQDISKVADYFAANKNEGLSDWMKKINGVK